MSTSRYSKSNWTPSLSAVASWTFDSTAESFTVSNATMTRQTGTVRSGAGAGQFTTTGSSGRAYKAFTRTAGRRCRVTYYDWRQSGAAAIGAAIRYDTSNGFVTYAPTTAWTQRTGSTTWYPGVTTAYLNFGCSTTGNGIFIDDIVIEEEDYDGWLFSSPNTPDAFGFPGNAAQATYYEIGVANQSGGPSDITITRTITGLTSGRSYRFRVDARCSNTTYPADVTIGVTGVGNTTTAITSLSQTFINYDFTATGSSHVFTVRAVGTNVRAGIRIYSVNLLEYNAPNAPTLTTRTNFSPTTTAAFAWTFSDPDAGDTQSAYRLQIADDFGLFSNIVFDSGKTVSGTSNRTLAASALLASTAYSWRVKTWDNDDVEGPWSSTGSFSTLNVAPTVTLTTRTMFNPLNSATFAWTYADYDVTDPQSAWLLRIYSDAGLSNQVYSASASNSAASASVPGGTLNTATQYWWTLRVTDTDGPTQATSSTGTFTTAAIPSAPTLTNRTDFDADDNATFGWAFNDADNAVVYSEGFEVNTGGWSPSSGFFSRDTSRFYAGVASANLYGSGSISASRSISGLTIGRTYTFSARAAEWDPSDAQTTTGWLSVDGIGSGASGTLVSYLSSWALLTYTFVATSTSHTFRLNTSAAANPDTSWDEVTISEADSQGARQVVIKDAGVPVFDTGKTSTSNDTYVLTGGSIASATSYTWEVTTWDSYDLQSPTASGSFRTFVPGTVMLDYPAPDGVEIDTDDFIAEWTFAPGEMGAVQAKYRVIVTNTVTSATHLDTGWVTSTNTTQAVTGLDSDVLYEVSVQVEDSLTVLTEPVVGHILPNYNEPMVPTAVLTAYPAYVEIVVTNPTPTGDKPEADYNEIRRSRAGENSYQVLGTVGPDGTFLDYFIAANVGYDYVVKAVTE